YVRANGMLVPGPRLIGRLLNARSPERHPERPGDRVAALGGRRRRPLPSPRAAFPEHDLEAGARPGTGEDAAGGRSSRRRRRRVRGRSDAGAGVNRPGAPPTITFGMSPSSEPGPDEPATQAEIDRFAALVEQLLGDGGIEQERGDLAPASEAPTEPTTVESRDALGAAERPAGAEQPGAEARPGRDVRPERGPFDRTAPGQRRRPARRGSRRGQSGRPFERPSVDATGP